MSENNTDNIKDSLENESLENKEQDSLDDQETIKEDFEKKINYLEDQLKRTLADFSNYKKRILKDQENLIFQDSSKIILEFLSFKEIIEKAIEHEENNNSKNNLTELNNNFENILKRLNVQKINLKDQEYDYNLSECVQTIKVLEKEKNNMILEVLENAYTYKEKLIKPGKVIIGSFTEE